MMGLSSCGMAKRSASRLELAGDWNVISLEGKAISVADEQRPYLGLNMTEQTMSGTTGCNRMMSAVNVDAKLRTISFGPVAGTRMACPDMSLEQALFVALEKVRNYGFGADGSLVLKDENGGELMVLRKK